MERLELEQALKQRMIDVVKNDYKGSVNKFALELGLRQTTLNEQINGESKISASVLLSLLNTRPDISAEWLLRGTGERLVSPLSLEARIAKIEHLLEMKQSQT